MSLSGAALLRMSQLSNPYCERFTRDPLTCNIMLTIASSQFQWYKFCFKISIEVYNNIARISILLIIYVIFYFEFLSNSYFYFFLIFILCARTPQRINYKRSEAQTNEIIVCSHFLKTTFTAKVSIV